MTITNKYKFLLFGLVCVLATSAAFAQQTVVLHMRNAENGQSVPYAKVSVQGSTAYTTENASFVWNLSKHTQITISAWNFADTTINRNQLPQNDTVVIYLRPQPEQLNEVLVNPKNSWLKKRIYGFERWQTPTAWGWAFLTDKELYVANPQLDLLYKTPLPKVGGKTPKEIYKDVLSNNYLLGKDSVQQIYVTDSAMYVYPQRAENVFNAQIEPLLLQLENGLIYRETKEVDYDVNYLLRETGTNFEFSIKHPFMHNCGIQINYKNQDTMWILIKSVDASEFENARYLFVKALQQWLTYEVYMEKNMVMVPEDMDMKEKADSAMLYKTQGAQYRHSYFLPLENKYFLLDPYSKQLITFNKDLKAIKSEPFDFTNCLREEYLYVDDATGKWWLQRRVRGLDQLESVRPGDPPESIILDPFVRNIRVHNNVVFYINERGQFRVMKI
jgi:hypothetical protein